MSATASKPVYNRKNPCIARLARAYDLTGAGAPKHTRHYEFSLQGSGMEYLPGDSLAVLPQNDPDLVDDLLQVLGADGSEMVPGNDKAPKPLREALITDYAITQPGKKFLRAFAEKAGPESELAGLMEPGREKDLESYLWGQELIDLLMAAPSVKFELEELVGTLQKLVVRLYSISSSLRARPDQVDLTVATVRYDSHGRSRKGVASTWLAERIDESTEIPCFISPGKGFRMPEPEEETPIIMCGPGTGIAPFRAFLQERRATSAKGKAWLFFGETHSEHCYFYKDEFESYLADGTLDRIDTAFSRDQETKLYVQHRMLEAADQLFDWLEQGAIFYVCGDASRMAVDVDRALHKIVERAGGKTEEQAADYIQAMKDAKRYRRDVY